MDGSVARSAFPKPFLASPVHQAPALPQARISISVDPSVQYPSAEHYFSPGERYPEYVLGHYSPEPNPVYRIVRTCLANAGLDASQYGKPAWNPLRQYLKAGSNVFLLCNFVKHDDLGHGPSKFSAKCTHGSVVRALLDYVLIALNGSGTVGFGNAPIQSCDWDRVMRETGAARLEEFYANVCSQPQPVRATDLRSHVVRDGLLGGLQVQRHAEDDACREVDLGKESLLEELYAEGRDPRFRVLDYDPRRTERRHGPGRHVYVIHRKVLESDVVISVPKLKTHEKVGITGGIKGCVGAVAHKDCLAHHRLGRPGQGGDEYPDGLAMLAPLSALHDYVNCQPPGWRKSLAHSADVLARKVLRRFTRAVGGSWPGNDTCWRMALDLARILVFADKEGRLQSEPQRTHLVFTDGIVAGEGNGPLNPDPVDLGYVAFANNVAAGDYVNALAMGFDPVRIPLIRAALESDPRALAEGAPTAWDLKLNGRAASLREIERVFTHRFAPPRAWRGALERNLADRALPA